MTLAVYRRLMRRRGLRERQGIGGENYYVLVPFETYADAEWATGEIGVTFDCAVIPASAVDTRALILSSVVCEGDEGLTPIATEREGL